jgi:hypothetical protein
MNDRITSATPLTTGAILESANGQFRLRLDKTGNLFLTKREPDGRRTKYWETRTGSFGESHRPVRLALGADGRLRLLDANRQLRWRTTARNVAWTGAVAILRDDGNLVELPSPAASKPVWASGRPDGVGAVGGPGRVLPPVAGVRSTLRQGETLKAGDSLTSSTGQFRLAMQEDGNLVLYAKAADGGWTAYWDTGTWALPATERPTRLALTDHAELHLMDDSGAKKWGSGTWGEGYLAPFLTLQDDGNAVLVHDTWRAYWATGTPTRTGIIGPRGHRPGTQSLDAVVQGCGRLPAIVTGVVDQGDATAHVNAGGVDYTVSARRRQLVNEIVEHTFLQDQVELSVWPGQVIQGGPLLAGDVAAIPGFARSPGTVEITTNLVSTTPGPQSRQVKTPDADTVNSARRGILEAIQPSDSAGLIKIEADRASTYREFATKFAFHVKAVVFGVEGNVELNSNFRETTAALIIRQTFYTTTFTPQSSGAGGLWDGSKVRFDDLEPYAFPGNPPLYVDSVSYGRFICVTAQGAHSSSELAATLKANWKAVVSGDVEGSHRQKEVLESSRMQIYTIGVPGHRGFQTLSNPTSELDQVYKNGLQFSLDNPGAPISFTARHVADNTLARVGMVADYVQPLQVVGEDVHERYYEVWDGPGGGNKGTGITVNPGDSVKIHAGGRISSGIIFSAPHGPDGWVGHESGNELPVPGKHPPYGLIHRYGSTPWNLTWSQFERTVPADRSGHLQLGINDNNPFNGSSRDRWRIWVSVRRTDAASVGVYI